MCDDLALGSKIKTAVRQIINQTPITMTMQLKIMISAVIKAFINYTNAKLCDSEHPSDLSGCCEEASDRS